MASLKSTAKDTRYTALIHWGVATKPLKGQKESGDRYLVKDTLMGCLVAVVDGLGHGGEAADAANRAISTIEAYANESVITILRRCHDQLRGTRGVVMSIASFNRRDDTITWVSVGNVEGILYRADPNVQPQRETMLLRGGVVGYQLPQIYAAVLPIQPGDTLVFATDGIEGMFAEHVKIDSTWRGPEQTAEQICALYGKETDDALVLIAQYVGKRK